MNKILFLMRMPLPDPGLENFQMKLIPLSTFEYLHNELVQELLRKPAEGEDDQGKLEHYYSKVEEMGFSVGMRLLSRCAQKRERKTDRLSTVKFICKDFWMYTFKKSIDKLQTNHRGVFVLHDNKFPIFTHIHPRRSQAEKQSEASLWEKEQRNFATFTCGIIRGAFAQLGEECSVTFVGEKGEGGGGKAQFHVKF